MWVNRMKILTWKHAFVEPGQTMSRVLLTNSIPIALLGMSEEWTYQCQGFPNVAELSEPQALFDY